MPRCAISEFLDNPATFDTRAQTSYVKGYGASHTKNNMARHLGFDDFSPPGFNVSDWIKYIDERFHFIGLVEYLPESLVYIRRLLNWNTKDLLSLPLRKQTLRKVASRSLFVNQSQIQTLKKKYKSWDPVDHRLYDYFAGKFHQKISALGDDFQREVETFKIAQSTVSEFCAKSCPFLNKTVQGKVASRDMQLLRNTTVHIEETIWNSGFYVSLEDCLLMMVNPDAIRKIQISRKQQGCNEAKCHWYLGHSLPTEQLTYLSCIGEWEI
jgi:hypothetical protein